MNAKTASAWFGSFGWLAFVLRNAFVPSLLSAVAVVTVLPFNFAAFAVWLVLLASSVRQQLWQKSLALAVTSVMMQLTVLVAIVMAANLAPGKSTDRFLDRPITIPKERMALGELEVNPDGNRPEWRPFSVSIYVPDKEKTTVIEFRETKLTLRQFVCAIESQSSLRHRFFHCGNGWTILGGGDCSFGLSLRHPPDRPY